MFRKWGENILLTLSILFTVMLILIIIGGVVVWGVIPPLLSHWLIGDIMPKSILGIILFIISAIGYYVLTASFGVTVYQLYLSKWFDNPDDDEDRD